MCQLNIIEDEFQFLTTWPMSDDLRGGPFSVVNVELLHPKTQFSNIMRSENTAVIRCLAEFIMHADKLRHSHPFAI